ncbi:MAG: DUF503 domain-containing protein [Planctomycetota bacterium]
MVVGVLQIELAIHGAESLKDKRRVVRSLKDRLHREHQVSVAEVASLDSLTTAQLGVTCAGAEGQRVGEVLDKVSDKLRKTTEAEVVSVRRRVGHVDTVAPEAPIAKLDTDALAAEMLARAGDAS